MAQTAARKSPATTDDVPSKKELQQQMAKTRESVSETVEEIKETVGQQVAVAKETIAGVVDFREHFQREPLVWSLGALSAGFALGYTMGYAHKETKGGRNKSQVAAFTNSLVDELSLVGNSVVMPALNAHIKDMFGFDFAAVLTSIGKEQKKSPKRRATKRATKKVTSKSRRKAA
jgi:hypothetical protein